MTRASKAALLSGLIFPGAGHISLHHYFRAAVLMVVSLAALSILIRSIFQRALAIVDRINSADVTVDIGTIAEMVTASTGGTNSPTENAAMTVLVTCWLIGIIDSYRLGGAEQS